jgi:hypothetical protein
VNLHVVAGRGRALNSVGSPSSWNNDIGTYAIHVRKSVLGLIEDRSRAGVELLINSNK